MPPHWFHRKWNIKFGYDPYIASEVDKIIDRGGAHDIIKRTLRNGVLMDFILPLFTNNISSPPYEVLNFFEPEDLKAVSTWYEIYNRFGREGIEIAVLHVVLDYIEQRHLDGFTKKEIKVRLWKYMGELLEVSKLDECVLKLYDEIYEEVISLGPPSPKRIQKRVKQSREMRNLYGVVEIFPEGKILPTTTGINYIKKRIKEGRKIHVRFKKGAYGPCLLERTISSIEELDAALDKMRKLKPSRT